MKWLQKIVGKSASTLPKASPPQVRVSDYLSEKAISIFSAGPSKQQVLGKLIGSLDLPDPTAALKAIMAREDAGTTVIGPGIALPHARISGIPKIVAALGICESGVFETRSSASPIQLFMLFLGPYDNMRDHLAFLASVSHLLQSSSLTTDLIKLRSPHDVLERIREAEGLR
jgi:mannitol/fructose-specific phosphotransferase system IIA component (Ntr-type)